MKDKTTWNIFSMYLLILFFMLMSSGAFSQIQVVVFNAGWNDANKDDVEVARFQADLSFKMVATKEDVQEEINNQLMSDF